LAHKILVLAHKKSVLAHDLKNKWQMKLISICHLPPD